MTDEEIKYEWLRTTGVLESDVPYACVEFAREIERRTLERAARMLEKLADDFSAEYGHDDMGALSFGQGSHAHEKMDRYTDMLDYAEAIRALEPK